MKWHPWGQPPSSSVRVPVCGCCNGSQIHLSFMEQQAAKRSRNEVQWLPGKTERKPEAGAGLSPADSPRRCTFWIRSFSFVSLRRITDKSNFRWKRFLLAHSSGYSPSWPRRPGGRRRGSWSRDTCGEINAGAQLASSFHTVQEPSLWRGPEMVEGCLRTSSSPVYKLLYRLVQRVVSKVSQTPAVSSCFEY